jgi:hypothetical protein
MTASGLLNTFSMAAEPIWGPKRSLRGLRINLHPETDAPVDVGLLLRSIENAVRGPAPTLILGSHDNQLLSSLMKRPAMDGMWLEITHAQLTSDEAMLAAAEEALRKGWTMVCSCDATETPDEAYAFLYKRLILDLGPTRQQAKRYLGDEEPPAIPHLNYQKGQIYVGADSQALVRHCLDQEQAWGMVGWPQHDMVKQSRGESAAPQMHAVTNMIKFLDKDASIDQIENCLHQDPVLAYRFMRFVNSVAMGRQSNIDTPRRGLTLVGLTAVGQWLKEQETVATRQSDLTPLRLTAVIRGILTEAMLEVGVDHELQKELWLALRAGCAAGRAHVCSAATRSAA